jgi:thioredoxin reductase (NADPH)
MADAGSASASRRTGRASGASAISPSAKARTSGGTREFQPAGVFVFIGLTPNSGFLKGAVETDQWGFIQTDATFQTSMPGVFAAGDVRAGSTKQLASAIGEGVTALLMVRQHLQKLGDVPEKVAESA